jgi:3-oxoacyl-(acyl-carrier-protein) synthase
LLVLEEAEAARKRGAKVYAQVAGFGAAQSMPAADLGHPNAENQGTNEGLELAIRAALRDAKLKVEDIDAVIPQGCGIPTIDSGEAGALRQVFGDRLDSINIVTVAPFIGDCAAGNGSILAAVGALCLKEQRVPARVETGSLLSSKSSGATPARPAKLRAIVVCSSAQGGQNAAVILKAVA